MSAMTKTAQPTTTLTVADIVAIEDRPDYLGFGYPNERRHARNDQRLADADAVVLDAARSLGWTAEDLFEWANSKAGRWFGDLAFGNGLSRKAIATKAAAWGLFDLTR